MDVAIVTPARPGTRHGNRNTALRWAAHFRALGHRARIEVAWSGTDSDVLVALHARRSHDSLVAWKARFASRPAILVLTGTDLYRDIRTDAQAKQSLDLADRLVVLQAEGLNELSARLRKKCIVIHQSVHALKRQPPPRRFTLITVIGHLREEKDPFRAVQALAHLPAEAPLRIVHLGGSMSAAMTRQAQAWMRREPRYRWLGERSHADAMRWLTRSHAMVISSRMEGGAHVVSEAIAAGVPVIASSIPGNVGLLGKGYAGYYKVEDDQALAAVLRRVLMEPAYLKRLEADVRKQRPLVQPSAERKALGRLLRSL